MAQTKPTIAKNSNLFIGLLFLFTTIMAYFLSKDSIIAGRSSTWYILLIIAAILSIYLATKKSK